MDSTWLSLLANLPLSRTEREVVRRFEGDPQGRTFLPVADILRSHRLIDESLELLSQGVERHPSFTVARVVLARELLQKGLVDPAFRTLEGSPVSLRENILAQKLRLRLTVLLSREADARATAQHMQRHQMLDTDTKRLVDTMEVSGLPMARSKLIEELSSKGMTLVLPEEARADEKSAAAAPQREPEADLMPMKAASPFIDVSGVGDDVGVSGFHVVPLDEIFRPSAGTEPGGKPRGLEGVELDSTTLADIYARQGHYSKALSVYRRLLRITPGNDMLRRKVGELTKLEREQKDLDLTVDPAVVDRMESVEIIDRQIRFYNDLLSRLS